MPAIQIADIHMYYEIHGDGEPLVLIAGLAGDHTFYRVLLSQLSPRYRVVVFDNRGVGRTDKPDIPYSIEMMADDTAGLLRALGIDQAHILGTSMGGRIAVALALQHPEQVASLILVSTGMKRLQGTPMTWSRRWISLMLRLPLTRRRLPYHVAIRQRDASRTYDCMDRLHEIHVPTLILHGKTDKMAPYHLAEAMHDGITDSTMLTFKGGHYFSLMRPQQVAAAITDFLDVSKPRFASTESRSSTLP